MYIELIYPRAERRPGKTIREVAVATPEGSVDLHGVGRTRSRRNVWLRANFLARKEIGDGYGGGHHLSASQPNGAERNCDL